VKETEMKKNRRVIPQPRRIELDYSEKWGKDVDEAVRLALADLKCSEDEVQVTVIEEPSKGFLGIGKKLAKVRVEMRKPDEESKTDAAAAPVAGPPKAFTSAVRDYRKNKDDESGAGRKPAGAGRSERSARPDRPDRPDRSRYGRREEGRGNSRRDEGRSDGRWAENRGNSRRNEIRGEGRHDGDRRDMGSRDNGPREEGRRGRWVESNDPHRSRPRENVYADASERAENEERISISEKPENLRPVSDENVAAVFLRGLTEKMCLDVTMEAFENDECVYTEITGADSRMIIGKRGQTLDAIQYLANLVMNKNQEKYIRVIVDVEGYRSRREKTLEQLADRLARKVERTGRDVRLEPMNPYERKVIHATLQSNARVTTRSEGEEPYRRVIIEKK
jgi:predicted RNA-binding protein Jag